MLRRALVTVALLVLTPATVQAFDHHEHHHSSGGSGGDGCGSSSHGSSSSTSSSSGSGGGASATPSSSDHRRVFVTSTQYSGALGSTSAADAHCQESAKAARMSGTFRAWISDDQSDASARLRDAGPWYTMSDGLAFSSKAAMAEPPESELEDELGGTLPAGGPRVWSGSDATGFRSGDNCEGWTNASSDAIATTGTAQAGSPSWGGGGAALHCNEKAALLCFQQ